MVIGLAYPRIGWTEYNGLYEPLGVLYIASALRNAGHTVHYLDYTFCDELSELDGKASECGLLGIAVSSAALLDKAAIVARHYKEAFSEVPVVMGGAFASISPDTVLGETGADWVIAGEAEEAMVELAAAIEGSAETSSIKNLVFIDHGGTVQTNPRRAVTKDLDSIALPARDLVEYDVYMKNGMHEYSMVTTRGCPFHCTYCKPATDIIFGGGIRFRGVEEVAREVIELARLRGSSRIPLFFQDDTITMHPTRWFLRMGELLDQAGVKLVWHCNSRVDTVTEDKIAAMAAVGCHCISFGVESGSQRILDWYKKGTTLKQAEDAFGWCHQYGIEATANLMIGFPLETNEDLEATYGLLKRIKPDDICVYFSTAIPGQHMYEWARKEGYLREGIHGELYDPTCNRANEVSNMRLPFLSMEEVVGWKHKIERYRSFRKLTSLSNVKQWTQELVSNPGSAFSKAGKVLRGLSGRPD